MRVITGFVVAAAIAASGVGCMSGGNNGNGLIPVPGTPSQKTEVFAGTVALNGNQVYAFAVANVGDLAVTLTSAGPPATVVMGLGIGISGGGTNCSLVASLSKTTPAGDTPQLAASQVPAGSYCVAIVDVGNATSPVTFSITVVHT